MAATLNGHPRRRSTAPSPSPSLIRPSEVSSSASSEFSLHPPRFTIDLSQRPEHRYDHLAQPFAAALTGLPDLFYEVLGAGGLSRAWVDRLTRPILRRVASREETAELRGISKATGIRMPMLVAFNVLLDLFMGCTSGGVRVRVRDDLDADTEDPSTSSRSWTRTRMLHFRTLDWGMDPLRALTVELAFVRRPGGPVVATTVTYFGYVGVLTGLRPGLSMSLNFRPTHDRSTFLKRVRFRAHQLLVILGLRKGIASVLREELLQDMPSSDPTQEPRRRRTRAQTRHATGAARPPSAVEVAERLRPLRSTAAYVILCDGATTAVLEKDHCAGDVRSAEDFIVAMNHDKADEEQPAPARPAAAAATAEMTAGEEDVTGMADLVAYSVERRQDVLKLWERDRRRVRADGGTGKEEGEQGKYGKMWAVAPDAVRRWMVDADEVANPETHFAVIMDPSEGRIVWLERYVEPLPLLDPAEKAEGV